METIKVAFKKDELQELSNAVGQAQINFRSAVSDTLEVEGKERKVLSDNDDEDENGLRLTIIGRHGEVTIRVDKVRYNKKFKSVECHICEEDYEYTDYWLCASYFGYDTDYIYDNIDWEED